MVALRFLSSQATKPRSHEAPEFKTAPKTLNVLNVEGDSVSAIALRCAHGLPQHNLVLHRFSGSFTSRM